MMRRCPSRLERLFDAIAAALSILRRSGRRTRHAKASKNMEPKREKAQEDRRARRWPAFFSSFSSAGLRVIRRPTTADVSSGAMPRSASFDPTARPSPPRSPMFYAPRNNLRDLAVVRKTRSAARPHSTTSPGAGNGQSAGRQCGATTSAG